MIEPEFTYSLLCQATIIAGVEQMNKVRAKANHIGNERERAITFHDEVVPLMEEIRKHVDDLEMVRKTPNLRSGDLKQYLKKIIFYIKNYTIKKLGNNFNFFGTSITSVK